MSKSNWAEKFSNDLSLCVAKGDWEIYKDGEGVKELYYKKKEIATLPSAFFELEVYPGGAYIYANSGHVSFHYLYDNKAELVFKSEAEQTTAEIDGPLVTFQTLKNDEMIEEITFDTNSFQEVTFKKDGQMGFDF